MNVIGSRPDGWWRDRRRAMRALADRLASFAEDSGEPVTLVLDGRPFGLDVPGIELEFAPGGPNAADDAIAKRVAADHDPPSITVVTSDKNLVGRVLEHGANVSGAREFRRRLDY